MGTLELIQSIRDGRNVRACEAELYAQAEARLLGRIEQLVTGRIRARLDGEDVLHEAFLRGMKALDLFKPTSESSFYAWIFTIAKNLVLDQAKRKSMGAVRFALNTAEPGPRASQVQGSERRPESLLVGREYLASLLAVLKEKEAEVIRLHRIEGLTFDEIASRWGKTPGAVQRFFSRSWQKLCAHAGIDTSTLMS